MAHDSPYPDDMTSENESNFPCAFSKKVEVKIGVYAVVKRDISLWACGA